MQFARLTLVSDAPFYFHISSIISREFFSHFSAFALRRGFLISSPIKTQRGAGFSQWPALMATIQVWIFRNDRFFFISRFHSFAPTLLLFLFGHYYFWFFFSIYGNKTCCRKNSALFLRSVARPACARTHQARDQIALFSLFDVSILPILLFCWKSNRWLNSQQFSNTFRENYIGKTRAIR